MHKLTRGDKIRSMNDAQLTDWIYSHDILSKQNGFLTKKEILTWIKTELLYDAPQENKEQKEER